MYHISGKIKTTQIGFNGLFNQGGKTNLRLLSLTLTSQQAPRGSAFVQSLTQTATSSSNFATARLAAITPP